MKITDRLFEASNTKSLSLFRMLFGAVMLWEFLRWSYFGVGQRDYLDTVFQFKFPFFDWVKLAPAPILQLIFWGGVLFSLSFILGWFYRISSIALLLLFSYVALLDLSYWNNHYYFYMLLLFLFSISNAHHYWSIDKKRFALQPFVPNWQIWAFWFQIVLVLFYGALSKITNPDWFSGEACSSMLPNRLLSNGVEASEQFITTGAWVMTWGGFFFDLLIGFLLISKRFFWVCVVLCLSFNLTNAYLFPIGTFPWAMLATLMLFLPVNLEKKLLGETVQESKSSENRSLIKTSLVIYCCFQILFPLRHFLYKGNVIWTSEGKLCGWHMMSGSVQTSNRTLFIEFMSEGQVADTATLYLDRFLNEAQIRCMSKNPYVIPDFVKYVQNELMLIGDSNVRIYSNLRTGRNGRTPVPRVSLRQDLTTIKRKTFGHNDWILLYKDEGY